MRYFHRNHNTFWRPVINLDKLHVRAYISLALLAKAVGNTNKGKLTD